MGMVSCPSQCLPQNQETSVAQVTPELGMMVNSKGHQPTYQNRIDNKHKYIC